MDTLDKLHVVVYNVFFLKVDKLCFNFQCCISCKFFKEELRNVYVERKGRKIV